MSRQIPPSYKSLSPINYGMPNAMPTILGHGTQQPAAADTNHTMTPSRFESVMDYLDEPLHQHTLQNLSNLLDSP